MLPGGRNNASLLTDGAPYVDGATMKKETPTTQRRDNDDTIVAIATPPGQGGVGIIRLSGPDAAPLATSIFRSAASSFTGFVPRHMHYGHAVSPDANEDLLDEVLAVWMPGPNSFTGENVVEFHCHGGNAILQSVLDALIQCGARPAERGEFTKRAFLNGRLDLTQAEAVAEAIAAPSREGARLAQAKMAGRLGHEVSKLRRLLMSLKQNICVSLDFPEDEIEEASPEQLEASLLPVMKGIRTLLAGHERARAWREGALAVLAGKVNAGKSSLLNALLGYERAIVTELPGTTRDYLEETLLLDGLPVRMVDTAGLRPTGDIVERQGVERSRDLATQADLVVFVHDAASPLGSEEHELLLQHPPERVLAVLNKSDTLQGGAPPAAAILQEKGYEWLQLSAKSGQGVEELALRLRARLGDSPPEGDLAPNLRQSKALAAALEELEAMRNDLAAGVPYDLLDVRVEAASHHLARITGEVTADDVLNEIFDSFCIGK